MQSLTASRRKWQVWQGIRSSVSTGSVLVCEEKGSILKKLQLENTAKDNLIFVKWGAVAVCGSFSFVIRVINLYV